MAVASRNNATTGTSGATNTNTASVTKPTGTVAGDVVVLVISSGGGSGGSITTPPTGFTLTSIGQNNSGTNVAQWVYYRVCDGTEASTFSAVFNATRPWAMVACGYTGVDANNPISGQASTFATASASTVAFANYNQHTESDFLVNLVTTRNITAVRTVLTASTGFTTRGDTSSTTASPFIEAALEDGANSGSTLQPIAIAATTMSAAVTQSCSQTIGLRAAVTNAGLDIDVAMLNTAGGSLSAITSDSFKTGYANEAIIVMFAASSTGITATISSTTGVTFTEVTHNNTNELVYVWKGLATAAGTAGTITATLSAGTFLGASLVVYTIRNTDTVNIVGASTSTNGTPGAPSATIATTQNGSWVWGNIAYASVTAPTVGTAQTRFSAANDGTNSFVTQRQNAVTSSSGTNVTINDTAPSANNAAIAFEILPVPPTVVQSPPPLPFRIANRMVGPMALRQRFRQPYVPTSAVAVNQPPIAPTLITPANSGTAGISPTLIFSDTDPDVDDITYEVQVDTSNTFGTGIATPTQVHSVFSTPTTALTNAALLGTVTVGNTIIVATNDNNGALNTISNVTDNLGNTYNRAISDTEASFVDGEIWYANVTTGGACTVTIHTAAGAVTLGFGAVEYSGILEPSPLDKTAVGHAITGTAMTTAASATTTNANEVVISALLTNGTGTTTFTAGTGYGHLVQHADATSGIVIGIEDKTVSATGAQTATATISSSGHWVILLATFVLQNNPPLIDALSAGGAGFVDATNGADTDPFHSGDTINYTVQISLTPATTYFWRVRGKDPSGTNTFGAWSSTFSFTAQSGTTFTQALAGSISFVGGQSLSTKKTMTASVSFSGSLARIIQKTMTAAVSFSGSLGRFIKKTMSAAVSFVGNFTAGVFHLVALAAAISFSGSLPRKTSKGMTAAVSFSAALNRFVSKGMTAAVSFSGAISKLTKKGISAAISFVGNFVAGVVHLITQSASVSFSGSLPRRTSKSMSAAVSFSAAISRFTKKGMVAAVSFAGILNKLTTKTAFAAAISFAGSTQNMINKSINAVIMFYVDAPFIYNAGFEIAPTFVAAQTSDNWIDGTASGSSTNTLYGWRFGHGGSVAVQFDPSTQNSGVNSLKASTTAVASFVEVRDAAGYNSLASDAYRFFLKPNTIYNYSTWMKTNLVSGDSDNGANITMQGADVTGTNITTRALTSTVKTTTGWTNYTGSFTTSPTEVYGHIECRIYGHTGVATLIMDAWYDDISITPATPYTSGFFKKINKAISGSISFSGSLPRKIFKGIAAAVSFVGSILKFTTKTAFTAALSFAGNLITGTVHKLALAASISFSGAITRRTNKGMTASVSFSGALSRFISKGMTAAVSFVGTNLRRISKSMTASVSFSGAANLLTKKGLAAAISFSGSISRFTKKSMTAAVSFSAALAKRTAKSMTAAVSFVGSVLNNAHNHFTMLLTASVSFSGSMNKRTKKTMSSSVSFVGAMATSLIALVHHFADPIILSLSTFLNTLIASSPVNEIDAQVISADVGLQDVIVTLPLSHPIINLELGSSEPLILGVS